MAARLELRHALGLPLQPVSGAGGELRSGMHPDAPASAWRYRKVETKRAGSGSATWPATSAHSIDPLFA